MIATLALLSFAATSPVIDGVKFSQKIVLDETTNYVVDVTGGSDAGDMKIALEFTMKAKAKKDDTHTAFDLHVNKSKATFQGQESDIGEVSDLEIVLDHNGAPSEMKLDGFSGIFYVVMLTRYLPDKDLAVGDKFPVDVKMGESTYKGEGSYSGTGELEGKKYPVIETKCQLSPQGDDPGDVSAKSYFDPEAGKIVRTEATIGTPGGKFTLTITTKP